MTSLNQDYLKLVQAHALSLLSCQHQNGITCQPDASIMFDKCITSQDACGMDFTQWYEQYTTAALKADVQKVIGYYSTLQ